MKKHAPVASSSDKSAARPLRTHLQLGSRTLAVLTAAIGRIYYAWPDPSKWSYSGISGAVVFGWGTTGGWLKVVDLAVSTLPELKGVGADGAFAGDSRGDLAAHDHGGHVVLPGPYLLPHLPRRRELLSRSCPRSPANVLPTQECMIGLAFSSESEAAELFKKVAQRHKYAKKAGTSTSSPKKSSSSSGSKGKKGGINKSMIGAPSGFSHVAHMGFDAEKGFSSTNVDPSWERLLGQLESQGISRVRLLPLPVSISLIRADAAVPDPQERDLHPQLRRRLWRPSPRSHDQARPSSRPRFSSLSHAYHQAEAARTSCSSTRDGRNGESAGAGELVAPAAADDASSAAPASARARSCASTATSAACKGWE